MSIHGKTKKICFIAILFFLVIAAGFGYRTMIARKIVPNVDVSSDISQNNEIAKNLLEESNLSNETMISCIKQYWEIFNDVFAFTEEDIQVSIEVLEDGSIVLISEENTTRTEVARWHSAEDAFVYLLENGFVNTQGEVLVKSEDIISEFSVTTNERRLNK